jgi:hypothetical protein
MLIGINGKIGSGKDTVGKIIQYLMASDEVRETLTLEEWLISEDLNGRDFNWKIKKFAGKLKEIASLLTGISVEMFEDQEFKKLDMSPEWGMTYREFLQKLGTEAMRDGLHTNVWVNALFSDYKDIIEERASDDLVWVNKPNWIITDMRFPNELEAVIKNGGITIRVTRSCGSSNFEGTQEEWDKLVEKNKQALHPSETALDNTTFDYEIINDGTIEDLIDKVKEILINEKINGFINTK